MSLADRILETATNAGVQLLESGAETFRVEDTVCRICSTMHLEKPECFCMPTGLFTSVEYEGKVYTRVVRIKERKNDLEKIHLINDLSRHAGSLTIDEFEQRLNLIIQPNPYNVYIDILFASLGAFGFTFVFGGTIKDACFSFIIGSMIRSLMILLNKSKINSFFINTFCSLILTSSALILHKLNLTNNYEMVIIGTIMLLVPGLAITNAVRDSLAGDLVSGLARATEAILIAVSVALGSGIAIILLGGLL
ncbi:MAG: threonine/serine exporter family protein [Erysipelotrichaceae bacterium]|nr:threonine/serine exporter family protein [Erysipelotrichaceae bacterium]